MNFTESDALPRRLPLADAAAPADAARVIVVVSAHPSPAAARQARPEPAPHLLGSRHPQPVALLATTPAHAALLTTGPHPVAAGAPTAATPGFLLARGAVAPPGGDVRAVA